MVGTAGSPAERRPDAQLINGMNELGDVVREQLAQHLIPHRRFRLAPHAVAEQPFYR